MSKTEYGGLQFFQPLCSSQSEDVQQTSFTDINVRVFIACIAVNYVGGRARKIMPDGVIGFRGSDDCGGVEERTCMCISENGSKKKFPPIPRYRFTSNLTATFNLAVLLIERSGVNILNPGPDDQCNNENEFRTCTEILLTDVDKFQQIKLLLTLMEYQIHVLLLKCVYHRWGFYIFGIFGTR